MTETLGLRERKRNETRAQLERAAVSIVLTKGLEHATIDAISAAANVSPRTFFNYFDSKEDAILGVHDVEVTDELVAAHLAEYSEADLIASAIGLLFTVISPSMADSSLHGDRMTAIKQNPQLLARQVAQMTRMTERLSAAIGRMLKPTTTDQTAVAEIVFALAGGAFRAAVKEWINAGGTASREELELRAVELARKAIGELK